MARFFVESGNMSEIVDAKDMDEALAAAIRQHIDECNRANESPGPWGEIVSCIEVTEDAEMYYMLIAPTLQDVGVNYRRKLAGN